MQVRLKGSLMIVTAEWPTSGLRSREWITPVEGHVFRLIRQDGRALRLASLESQEDACREPINVTSRSLDAAVQLISNLWSTPFTLDGRGYRERGGVLAGSEIPG